MSEPQKQPPLGWEYHHGWTDAVHEHKRVMKALAEQLMPVLRHLQERRYAEAESKLLWLIDIVEETDR